LILNVEWKTSHKNTNNSPLIQVVFSFPYIFATFCQNGLKWRFSKRLPHSEPF
jgi:hypothetical protein